MIKKVKNYFKKKVSKIKEDKVNDATLQMWQGRLENALSSHGSFREQCAINDEQYNNSRAVGAVARNNQMSSDRTATTNTKDARQVIGLTFQLIESTIDINVPQPRVDELEEDDIDRKNMIEGQLKCYAESDEFKALCSENERITKKNGYSIMKVCYDPDYDGHSYKGRIKIINPHPSNVIFQPNIHNIRKMNYLFHVENRYIDDVILEFGEEYRDQLMQDGAEYSYLEDISNLTRRTSEESDMLSVIECWYKDKEGDVCLIVWCNDIILKDVKKFYYKKDLIDADGVMYEEVLKENYDEQGNVVGTEMIQVRAKVPKHFPFVQWFNVPKEKSIRGKSDPEIIVDQQDSIKKVMSNEEERLIKGNTKVITRKGSGLANKINNSITQILETDNPMVDVNVIDMKTQDRSLKEWYQIMTAAAKDSLGVTDASQGILQNNQLSGRAIEQLSANSTGRLVPKIFQKNLAYSQLYRLCYEHMIAFYDDKRPYKYDNENKKVYGYFNKSDLVKQDDAGEYYYPEFDITITTDSGAPKDRRFMLDFINGAGDRIDNLQYWTLAESIGIPGAGKILDAIQEQKEAEEEMLAQQQQMQQQQAQQPMPQEQPQPDMMDDILQSLTPEQLAEVEANPQLLQQIMMQGGM